jgi:large subunit ribosomal protein L28
MGREIAMSRRCELSGVGVLYGNKVSHSQRKTRRRFEPNLRVVRFASDLTKQEYKLSVNAKCMRSVEKVGGFDAYMLKISCDVLSDKAQVIKRKIVEKKVGTSL